MTAAFTTVLALLGQLLPALSGNSEMIANIINALIQIIPVIVKEVQDVAPMVKNIIAALKNDPATTADQLAQLDALDAQVDQAFEAAATDAQAQDSAQ